MDLRLNLNSAAWLPDDIKEALREAVCDGRVSVPGCISSGSGCASICCWKPPAGSWLRACILLNLFDQLQHPGRVHTFFLTSFECWRMQEKNRINGEGELVVTSQRTRTQG